MPTATFFRLPEEKRERLIEACWSEISQVRFSDISINRIIAAAHIPRGSFYQYFGDKEDLLRYLLEDMRQYFIAQIRNILIEVKGDLFAFPLAAYDRFTDMKGSAAPMLTMFIGILRLNRGIDIHSLLSGSEPCEVLPEPLWEVIDAGRLRHGSWEYAGHVFYMACAALACAVAEALWNPARPARIRATLQTRMDLLRCGGAAEGYKEVRT